MSADKDVELTDGIFTTYSVEQGDRVTLVKIVDGEPVFKQVMLSFIKCPKVGRRQGNGEMGEDEPCAYDSMDFVRAKIIGRQVRFIGHNYVAPLKRTSGSMHLQDGTDIAVALLKAGLAKIPVRCPEGMDKELHADYLAAQTIAKANRDGIYADDAEDRVRLLLPHPPEDPEGFGDALYHTSMKVRVDRVASGTGLLLHVANPNDELEFQAIQACLTGAQANSTLTRDGSPDPFGRAAKAHTERFLLHRNVSVRFEGMDGNGNYLISVVSPNGTFQEDLLSKGLAKVNHATLEECERAEQLVEAEKAAKVGLVGIWGGAASGEGAAAADGGDAAGNRVVVVTSAPAPKDAEGQAAAAAAPAKPAVEYKGDAMFEGTVVQIINGDTMVVRNSTTKEYVRVSLAGVRANKVSSRDGEIRGGQRPPESRVSHESYTWEAKEFLRTTCIGQRVKVRVEYARVMDSDGKEVRGMASVIDCESGQNIGAAVLRQGLAKFFLGRNDVCSCEHELRAAEAAAADAGLRIHNTKQQAPSTKVTELNRIGEKQAKHYLSFFQRGMVGKKPPPMRAIVEAVMSGSSFRVYVPREHCQFTLKLGGIITPSNAGDSNDPFADESRDFAVTSLQQREVEVMVETVDRAGNFIGYLMLHGKNFAVTIVGEGLATCSGAERTLYPHELNHAETSAKSAKKNMWSDQGALPAMAVKRQQQDAARRAARATYAKPAESNWFEVNVTNVDSAVNIHVNLCEDEVHAQRDAMAPLIEAIGGDTEQKKYQPKKNEVVVVLFREDKTWYRGKVADVFPLDKRAEVVFMDFGNRIEASFKDIRVIPEGNDYDVLRSTPALAKAFKLAYLRDREDTKQFVDDAIATAWGFIEDVTVTLYARAEYVTEGGATTFYTIATEPDGATLQEELLRNGVSFVNRAAAPVDPQAVTAQLKHQEVARRQHIGMWIHGDFMDEDDE